MDKPATATSRKPAIILPMLAGGLLAGAIGFAAATLYFNDDPVDTSGEFSQIETTLAQQQQRINAAQSGIDDLGAAGASTTQDLVDLVQSINDVSHSVALIKERLLALEKRPIAEAGGVTQEAAAAFERDMAAMRELLAARRAEIEQTAVDAAARINAAAKSAAALEESARITASAASLRGAMAQLQVALDRGGAYQAALNDLAGGGVDIPPALANSATVGVPTLAALQESFPDAARAALATAGKADADADTMGKLGAFLRTQTGARSLEPREGNDTDAVLSRAEAALKNGELDVALALTGALPEKARAAMSDWISAARSRDGAVLALRRLTQDLSGN